MLSRFAKPSYKDRFTVSFLDRDGRHVRLRIRRQGFRQTGRHVAEIIVNGHTSAELRGTDPAMLFTCLLRECWNGGAGYGVSQAPSPGGAGYNVT